MRIKNPLLYILLIALLFSSYSNYEISIGGFSVVKYAELLTIVILIYLHFSKNLKINFPKQLRRIALLFLMVYLVYALLNIRGNLSNTIGDFRKLCYYPLLGITGGYTFAKLRYSKYIFQNLLSVLLYGTIILLVFNSITGLVYQEYGLIERFNGLLIGIIFFKIFFFTIRINARKTYYYGFL